MMGVLAARKYFVLVDQGWSEWDLEAHGGIWARGRIKVCTENHGGERRVLRVKCALRISRLARGVLTGAAVGAALGLQLGLPTLAATNVAIGVVGGRRAPARVGGPGTDALGRASGSGATRPAALRTLDARAAEMK